jgi:hypothetical protein
MLLTIVFNLDTMAEEIAEGSDGIEVLARAVRLIEAGEELIAGHPGPVARH